MAQRLEELLVELRGDTRQLRAELRRVQRETRSTSRGMERSFRNAGRGLEPLFTQMRALRAVIAGVAVAGTARFVRSQLEMADAVVNTAERLGLTIEQLQEYRFIAQQSGVDSRTLELAVQRFGRRMGEASQFGQGELIPALEALDIQLVNTDGTVRSIGSVFEEFITKLSQIEDPATRNALAMKGFDSEGVRLVQVAAQGSEGLARLRRQFDDLGGAIEGPVLRAMKRANEAFDRAGFAARQGLAREVGVAADELEELAEVLADPELNIGFGQLLEFLVEGATEAIKFADALADALNAINEFATRSGRATRNFFRNLVGLEPEAAPEAAAIRSGAGEAPRAGRRPVPGVPATGLATSADRERRERLEALRRELEHQDRLLAALFESRDAFENEQIAIEAETAAIKELGTAQGEEFQQLRDLIEANIRAKRAVDTYSDAIENLDEIAESGQTERERLLEQLADITDQARELGLTEEQVAPAIAALKDQLAELGDEGKEAFEDMRDTASRAFADMVIEGEFTFRRLGQSVARDFLAKAIEAGAQVALTQGVAALTGGVPFLGSIIGAIPGFQHGGNIRAGQAAIVGERGPELIVPRIPSTVIPGGVAGDTHVDIKVINTTGAPVQTNQRRTGFGRREIELIVGEAAARDLTFGGPLAKAANRPPLRR